MNDPIANVPSHRRRWRGWKLAGIGAAIAGLLAVGACHHGGPGWHHRHGPMSGTVSPEDAARRIDKAVNWVLDDVDATAEQKQRVAGIAKDALRDLLPMRDEHRAARTQAIELLTRDAIDRTALEQLRARELALAERASRRVTQALADLAEAITPEQRRKLAERYKRRFG